MEHILEKLEGLIDDIVTDESMDKDEILQVLNEIKNEIEEHQLRQEEDRGLQWNDLD